MPNSSKTATVDRRLLVAVGCEEGVWIGLRHDPRSLRKVLHVKAVTNIHTPSSQPTATRRRLSTVAVPLASEKDKITKTH
jgi:hypothetical protein